MHFEFDNPSNQQIYLPFTNSIEFIPFASCGRPIAHTNTRCDVTCPRTDSGDTNRIHRILRLRFIWRCVRVCRATVNAPVEFCSEIRLTSIQMSSQMLSSTKSFPPFQSHSHFSKILYRIRFQIDAQHFWWPKFKCLSVACVRVARVGQRRSL